MANVIIGIHGLGNKPPAKLLEQWWKLSMMEGLKRHGFNSALPKFELVYWADIIYENPLNESEKDEKSPFYIDEKYTEAAEDFTVQDFSMRRKVMDFVGHQLDRIILNEDMSLNYSFLTDVILSRYFKDLEMYYNEGFIRVNGNKYRTRDLIRERLSDKMEEHRKDNIMLIGHSMGSIIAYDVLTFVAPQIRINTFITIGSPLGFPVILGKIAVEQKQKSTVAEPVLTPPSVFNTWHNFSDIHDHIAFKYKLSDNFFENQLGIKPADHVVVNNYEYEGVRNPHKSFGYLRTPEFSHILNDFNLSERLTFMEKIIRKVRQIPDKIKAWIYRVGADTNSYGR